MRKIDNIARKIPKELEKFCQIISKRPHSSFSLIQPYSVKLAQLLQFDIISDLPGTAFG